MTVPHIDVLALLETHGKTSDEALDAAWAGDLAKLGRWLKDNDPDTGLNTRTPGCLLEGDPGLPTRTTALYVAVAANQLPVAKLLLDRGANRARSHCRFAPPFILFMSDPLRYSVSRLLSRQFD